MKKCLKILSILLVISFFILILNLPTTSLAASTVNSVYIAGIDEPVAGNTPDTTGTTGKGYSIYDTIDWYNVTDGRYMTSGEKFAYGKVYRVIVWVKASSGYEFSVSGTSPNVTGYINNKVATVNKAYGEAAYEVVEVTYDFDLSVLKKLELSGGVAPSVGADYPASNSWYVADGLHYTRTNTYTWYNVTDGRSMNSSDKTFEAGHIYKLTIVFEPDTGYSFDDPSNMTAVLKNISSSEYTAVVKKFAANNNPNRYVEFTFNKLPSNDIKVSDVTINGGAFPIAGENPDFNLSVPANANYRISNSGADWYSPNENYHLTPTDTFTYGQTYYLDIYLFPNTGYYFEDISAMTATLPDVTGNFTVQIFEAGSNRLIRFIVTAKKKQYTVRFESNGGSSVVSQTVNKGETISRPSPDPTRDGYAFVDWYVGSRLYYVYDFSKPVTSNFTLYAKWQENNVASGIITQIEASSNDIVQPVYNENMYIPTVTINSVTPANLFENVTTSIRWSHNDTSIYQEDIINNNLKFETGTYELHITFESNNNNVTYNYENFPDSIILNGITFTMEGCHESYVSYSKEFNVANNIVLPFTDIDTNKWYMDAVTYVYKNNIMTGYNATTFAPDKTITRGQIATMLYRLAGSPDTTGLENPFTDVPAEKYYTEAIKWAFSKGITTGKTATSFDPNGNVTRQELAVFMARYSKEILGNDITSTYDISGIVDYGDVSSWAIAPMQYIMEKGIITGDMKLGYPRILPRNNATRAEAATMFMRFCENI